MKVQPWRWPRKNGAATVVSIPLVLVVSLGGFRSDLLFGRKITTALFAECTFRPGGKKGVSGARQETKGRLYP